MGVYEANSYPLIDKHRVQLFNNIAWSSLSNNCLAKALGHKKEEYFDI